MNMILTHDSLQYLNVLLTVTYLNYQISGPSLSIPFVALDNDISSPIQGVLTFYLRYGYLFDFQPYRKSMKFIETKVAAIKMQGFYL